MFEWIKKHKALFIIMCVLIFIALIGVPFVINLLFKVDTNINVFQAEWTAGDALGYYGAVLSFLGTVTLGALALYQNHIIKEQAEQKAIMQEEKEHIENMPIFHMKFGGSSGYRSHINFIIKNVSKNISYDICIYDIRMLESGKTMWESDKEFTRSSLDSKDEFRVFLATPKINENQKVTLVAHMSCKDKYTDEHEYFLQMQCDRIKGYTCDKIKEIS